ARAVPVAGPAAPRLTEAELTPVVQAAIARWAATGLNASQVAALQAARWQITDLGPQGYLGLTTGNIIRLDDDGGGLGWFLDATPLVDEEFSQQLAPTEWLATQGRAAGHYDLLTVVMHELGHILGLGDVDPAQQPYDLLAATLDVGVRRLP